MQARTTRWPGFKSVRVMICPVGLSVSCCARSGRFGRLLPPAAVLSSGCGVVLCPAESAERAEIWSCGCFSFVTQISRISQILPNGEASSFDVNCREMDVNFSLIDDLLVTIDVFFIFARRRVAEAMKTAAEEPSCWGLSCSQGSLSLVAAGVLVAFAAAWVSSSLLTASMLGSMRLRASRIFSASSVRPWSRRSLKTSAAV